MAKSKNVIRQDIVQIGFEIDQTPLNNLENSLENVGSGARNIAQSANRAANEVSQIGTEANEVSRAVNNINSSEFQNVSNAASEAATSIQRYSSETEEAIRNTDGLGNNGFNEIEADIQNSIEALQRYSREVEEVEQDTESLRNNGFKDVGIDIRSATEAARRYSELIENTTNILDSLRNNGFEDVEADTEGAIEQARIYARALNEAVSESELIRNNGFQDVEADIRDAIAEVQRYSREFDELAHASERLRENGFDDIAVDTQRATEAARRYSNLIDEAQTALSRLRNNGFQDVESDTSEATEEVRTYINALREAANEAEQLRNNGFRDVEADTRSSTEATGELDSAVGNLTVTIAGAVAAFAANKILSDINEITQAINKLEAQTGATKNEMEQYTAVVENLYTSGDGESIADVSDALALVNQQFKDLDSGKMEQITNDALALRDTFDMDVNESLRGVNALMTNMGVTAEEAFDYISKGAQNGLDKSQELVDNIAEYSQIWSQAGFSAQEMFTILQNGLDSGAYNLDKVNDFVKEFTISLSDGRIEENIESFSENTRVLFEQWKNGEASQKDVFNSIIADLGTMTNEQEALSIASNVWSAVGEDNAMKVITSLTAVNDTYSNVKGTMESINDVRYDDIGTSFDRLTRSGNMLLNETLSPALTSMNNLLSDGIDWVTDFASEHETLTKSISATVLVATALTVGVGAFVAAANFIPPVILKISAAFKGLHMSMGVVGIAIAALSVGAGLLVAAFSDSEDEIEDYDGSLEDCRKELERTTEAHKKAVARYGENSDAAKSLEKDIDRLNAQYKKGGGRLEELQQRIDKVSEAYNELSKAQDETMSGLKNTETQGFQAVSMLEALSDKANITSTDLDTMSQYADYLNDTFHTNIVVDYEKGELLGFDPTVVTKQIIEAANDNKVRAAMSYLSGSEFTTGYINAAKEVQKLKKEFEPIKFDYEMYQHYAPDPEKRREVIKDYEATKKALEEAEKQLSNYDAELDKYGKIVDSSGETTDMLRDSLIQTAESGGDFVSFANDISEATEEVNDGMSGAQDAVSNYNDELYNLATAYDEALLAAQESVAGQYSAWDEVGEIAETSIGDLQKALKGQSEYWSEYADNLALLQEKAQGISGLSEMLATMADGSEDSASAIAALAGASDEELSAVVQNWQSVKDKQDEASQNMALTQTEFQTKLSAMGTDMQGFVEDMDMSTEAQTNASNTINAFIDTMISTIDNRKSEVDTALSSLMSAASRYNFTINTPVSVEGNATGTTNSADVFMAGEEGPELIVGKQGSTVFPTSETQKIIDTVRDTSDYSGGYTPEQSSNEKIVQSNVTYAPAFTLNMNGASATNDNKRKVKRWIKESINEALDNMSAAMKPVIEI